MPANGSTAIGIPAKSGVGGGILAALPARLGLGSYSPKLDKHGNSVRGIKVCEALSSHYDLHMLNRSDDARNSIIADYDIGNSPSRRVRRAHEQNILAAHHQDVRVIELVGTLSFSNVDYVSRQLAAKPRPQLVIFDLRRVTAMTRAGARLLAEEFRELAAYHVTVILSGIRRSSPEWKMIGEWTEGLSNIRNYYLLDAAIEWAEDQVVYRYGGAIDFFEATELSEQALLAGLTDEELTDLASLASIRTYQASEKIIAAGDPATSLFFLRSGVVHVTLPDGIRLATLTAGMPFGEMALLEPQPLRRRPRRHGRDGLRNPAPRFRTFPKAASARRRADHAQPRAIAGRPPDPRQRQGEFADVGLGSSGHMVRYAGVCKALLLTMSAPRSVRASWARRFAPLRTLRGAAQRRLEG